MRNIFKVKQLATHKLTAVLYFIVNLLCYNPIFPWIPNWRNYFLKIIFLENICVKNVLHRKIFEQNFSVKMKDKIRKINLKFFSKEIIFEKKIGEIYLRKLSREQKFMENIFSTKYFLDKIFSVKYF